VRTILKSWVVHYNPGRPHRTRIPHVPECFHRRKLESAFSGQKAGRSCQREGSPIHAARYNQPPVVVSASSIRAVTGTQAARNLRATLTNESCYHFDKGHEIVFTERFSMTNDGKAIRYTHETKGPMGEAVVNRSNFR
jgi:hypothetical protein